jgi:hypothetical protein
MKDVGEIHASVKDVEKRIAKAVAVMAELSSTASPMVGSKKAPEAKTGIQQWLPPFLVPVFSKGDETRGPLKNVVIENRYGEDDGADGVRDRFRVTLDFESGPSFHYVTANDEEITHPGFKPLDADAGDCCDEMGWAAALADNDRDKCLAFVALARVATEHQQLQVILPEDRDDDGGYCNTLVARAAELCALEAKAWPPGAEDEGTLDRAGLARALDLIGFSSIDANHLLEYTNLLQALQGPHRAVASFARRPVTSFPGNMYAAKQIIDRYTEAETTRNQKSAKASTKTPEPEKKKQRKQ